MVHKRLKQSYRKVFTAGIINGIGDRFNQVAVLAMVLSITGSGVAVGGALAIRIIPYLFFSPLGGWLSTVFSLKRIMVVTDLVRILFALSLLLVDGSKDLWIVYTVLFLLAGSEAIYQPVRRTYLSRHMDKEDLLRVNKLEQVLLGIVLIMGSAVGGVVSYLFSPQLVFIINAFTFLLAALILLTLHETKVIISSSKETVLSVIKCGWKVTMEHSLFRKLFLIEASISAADGIFNVLISVYAYQRFQMGDIGIGLFYGALGLGLVLSMWFPIGKKNVLMPVAIVTIFMEGLFQILLSQVNGFHYALLLFSLISLSGGIGKGAMDTILMKQLPKESQGPVYSLFDMVSNVVMGMSMFVTGIMLTLYPSPVMGSIAGGIFIIVSFAGFYGLHRDQSFQGVRVQDKGIEK